MFLFHIFVQFRKSHFKITYQHLGRGALKTLIKSFICYILSSIIFFILTKSGATFFNKEHQMVGHDNFLKY